MIKNLSTRQYAETVRDELKELGREKARISLLIKGIRDEHKITDNKSRKKSDTVPQEAWNLREDYIKQIDEIEKKLEPVREKWKHINIEINKQENKVLRAIFAEIFNDQQRDEIYNEARRRCDDEQPIPLGLNFKELERYKSDYYKYREVAKEQLNKMIEFRVTLTRLIEQGCAEFGNAEFLKFISPLNKLIIPVNEINKIKSKHFL